METVGFPPVAAVGVTAVDGAEVVPVPTALVALTAKVYGVPLVSPVTTALVAPVVVAVAPPGRR